ncbi:MAG TPA: Fic family protein [Thiobacillaceae bacterium]|nr:Fic family protein [Thiobacillaceae bacterium]HNA82215.1 Fic family protein [Thiobacillaceae bacterium]HNG03286.1 Fic family protein [Nitrospira sp.]HNI07601.1 Fic family protein [Thiobacillaceae bacterium]
MHSLAPAFLAGLRFDATQLATLRAIGEYRGKQALFYQQAPEALKRLRQVAVVESSESSNRLEGVTVAANRLKAIVLKNTQPKDRSEQEVAGYRDALALIHESARDMAFTPNVMLQLHAMMYRYMPNPGGRWKQTDNDIIERHPDGSVRVRFRPTPAHLTPEAVEALARNYREAVDRSIQDPLVILPLAILDFLCIHPFPDGNGRMARLLTLMLLYQFGYEVGRFISLERVIEDSKESYYETLEKSSQGWHEGRHDIKPWLDYFWGILLRAYREFEERIGAVHYGRGGKTEQVREAVLSRSQPFSISELEAACPGISRDMVRLVLRQMRDEGLIMPTGKGRAAKWQRVES